MWRSLMGLPVRHSSCWFTKASICVHETHENSDCKSLEVPITLIKRSRQIKGTNWWITSDLLWLVIIRYYEATPSTPCMDISNPEYETNLKQSDLTDSLLSSFTFTPKIRWHGRSLSQARSRRIACGNGRNVKWNLNRNRTAGRRRKFQ